MPQRKGGIKFAVDQMTNDNSIVLSIGGEYNKEAIIASKVGTISNTDFAKVLMKHLSSYFRKLKKVDRFYICPGALKAIESGVRFTTDIRIPIESDFKLEDL